MKAWGVMIKALQAFQPTDVVVLGDFIDCYTVSQHRKDPGRQLLLSQEVLAANAGLDQLDDVARDSRKWFVKGNHEHRLSNYIADHAPALHGMLDVDRLLHLKNRGWHVTPYGETLRIGRLNISHDFGDCGEKAVAKARVKVEGNAVIGHVHSMQVYYLSNMRGRAKVAASFGWLGSFKDIDYRHRDVARRCWQHGFGVGYMESNGTVHLQAIPIVDGRCVLEGKVIQ